MCRLSMAEILTSYISSRYQPPKFEDHGGLNTLKIQTVQMRKLSSDDTPLEKVTSQTHHRYELACMHAVENPFPLSHTSYL
jgi:hypothetical protein